MDKSDTFVISYILHINVLEFLQENKIKLFIMSRYIINRAEQYTSVSEEGSGDWVLVLEDPGTLRGRSLLRLGWGAATGVPGGGDDTGESDEGGGGSPPP